MNSSRPARWLLEELPGLVEKGVISAEAAESLRRHYGAEASGRALPLGLIVSAILGATLLGAGLILILAHNWDELTRRVRAVISFLPLLIALAISGFVVARRMGSLAWREGAGIFQCLAVAASIALVGQTYHLAGDFSDFLLTWMLLTLPVAYLLQATVPCALYIVGIAVWSSSALGGKATPFIGFLPLAAAGPFYLLVLRENRRGHRAAWLSILLALAVPAILGASLRDARSPVWLASFTGLFAAMYLTGVAGFGDEGERRAHPFRALGGIGVGVLSIVMTYGDVWGWRMTSWVDARWSHWFSMAVWLVLPVFLAGFCFRRRRDANPAVAAAPLVVIAGFALVTLGGMSTGAAVLGNAYALALGLVTLVRGIRRERVSSANAGMAIVAALLLVRFFDQEISFVIRGVAFMLVGAGFLAGNVILFRRRQKAS